jgi:putative glutamine amidotransferase
MRIALTRTTPPKYLNYTHWLANIDPDVRFGLLDDVEDPLNELEECDALLLPGGADVDPERFGKGDERDVCTINAQRDKLEFAVIQRAIELEMPIFGICRGLQIMNVALGGSLITDLPTIGHEQHHKIDGKDRVHLVTLEPGSHLARVIGQTEGETNSAHHQCADVVAPRFRVTARSADGIVEGMEWNDPEGKPYLLLVQWHPERMDDQESPFTKNLALDFLSAVRERLSVSDY